MDIAFFIQLIYGAAKVLPVIAVLWIWLVSKEKDFSKREEAFNGEKDKLQAKVEALYAELLKNNKDNLTLLNQLNHTLEKVVDDSVENREEVLREIKNLSASLSRKINELKGK